MNKLELVRKCGKIMSKAKVNLVLLHLQKMATKNNFLRAVIYHDTPPAVAEPLVKQFQFYQKHFSPVSKKDLDLFFQTKRWHKSKPGLMITFDDGLKSNFDVALPLLEKFGFTGWFFIPTGFINTPVAIQPSFAKQHDINGHQAMSWKEIRKLDQNHVIGCHTQSHLRMREGLSLDILQTEILESKKVLEEKLAHNINHFCWVGGELSTYTRQGYEIIEKAGYRYAFMTNSTPITPKTHPLFLDRTYVEPYWKVDEVAFMLCGVIDWLYTQKRKQVIRQLIDTTNKNG